LQAVVRMRLPIASTREDGIGWHSSNVRHQRRKQTESIAGLLLVGGGAECN